MVNCSVTLFGELQDAVESSFCFQPHNPATPGAMQADPSFKLFTSKIFYTFISNSKIHLPEYLLKLALDHYAFFSECMSQNSAEFH